MPDSRRWESGSGGFFENLLMFRKLGRTLQFIGLCICPIGIGGNLARPEDVPIKTSLAIAALGIIVFFLGWLIQQSAGSA